MKQIIKIGSFLFFFLFLTSSCNKFFKKEDAKNIENKKIAEKKRIEPNVRDRISSQDGIIFKSNKGSEFGNLNIMWVATTEVLSFIPVKTASYSGGIYVTEWYNKDVSSNESIQIKVQFLSPETSVRSIDVKTYKKICKIENQCVIQMGGEKFNNSIKDKIFAKVVELNTKK